MLTMSLQKTFAKELGIANIDLSIRLWENLTMHEFDMGKVDLTGEENMIGTHSGISDYSAQSRIESIDVFRIITMMVMVFVNELDTAGNAMILNVPLRLGHGGEGSTLLALADTVFPTFIFLAGMSIPFAIVRRLQKGSSRMQIWKHIFIRALSLMIIGESMGNMRIFYWNGCKDVYALGGMSMHLWSVLLYVSFILIWNLYPISQGSKRKFYFALRLCGGALLVFLLLIYRRGTAGVTDNFQPPLFILDPCWMNPAWYVLAMIGWAYLVSCGAYFIFRRQIAGMICFLGMMLVLSIGVNSGAFDRFNFIESLMIYVPLGRIANSSLYMISGVVIGMLFGKSSPAQSPRKRIIWLLVFAAAVYSAGFLLYPLFGAGKSYPYFIMNILTISIIAYTFIYWLVDVRGIKRWASLIVPAGKNTLLLYFVSFLAHPLLYWLGIHFINDYFNSGIVGIMRTVLYSIVLTLVISWMTIRCRIKLQL